MKKLIRLLVEGLFDDIYNLNNDVNDVIDLGNNLLLYNYYPKSFNELRNIIEQLLKERGKDADLNDIDISQINTFYNNYRTFGLFENLDPHNIDISLWNVSNVIDMSWTFYMCENLNCNLENWNVSKVEYMYGMFANCKNFTGQGLENWNVSNVKDMLSMFYGCEKFDCDLSNWNVSNFTNIIGMFDGCTSLKHKPRWYKV